MQVVVKGQNEGFKSRPWVIILQDEAKQFEGVVLQSYVVTECLRIGESKFTDRENGHCDSNVRHLLACDRLRLSLGKD